MHTPRYLRFSGPQSLELALCVAAKALPEGVIAGPLVLFTGSEDPDVSLTRDFFTKATDFDRDFGALDSVDSGGAASVYYNHGLDPQLKKSRLTRATIGLVSGAFLKANGYETKAGDDEAAAVWARAQIDLADSHKQAIYGLAKKGKLGWSSGSVAHLVERKSVGGGVHEVVSWPIAEASLTPTAAEPRNRAMVLKSLEQFESDLFPANDGAGVSLESLDMAVKSLEAIIAAGGTTAERVSDAMRWRLRRIEGMAAELLAEAEPVPVADLSGTMQKLNDLRQKLGIGNTL